MDPIFSQTLWNELEPRATDALLASIQPPEFSAYKVLRFSVRPSFSDYHVWTLWQRFTLEPNDQPAEYAVQHVRWRRDTDFARVEAQAFAQGAQVRHRAGKLKPLEPTVEVVHTSLELSYAERLLHQLRTMQLPLYIPRSNWMSVDGVQYELIVYSTSIEASFKWSNNEPEQWNALHVWVKDWLDTQGFDENL
jgi:hypothetical protein